MKLLEKYPDLLLKYKWFILSLVFVITVFFAAFIPRLQVNPDVMSYLPDNDPEAVFFNEVGMEFGGNQTGVIALKTSDVFTAENLSLISAMTDTIKNIPGVGTVVSLSNIIDIREEDSMLVVTRLVDPDNLPSDPASLRKFRDYVLSKSMYRGFLVSDDASMSVIAVKIREGFDIPVDTNLTGKRLQRYLSRKFPGSIYRFIDRGDTIHVKIDQGKVAENIRTVVRNSFPDFQIFFGGLPFMVNDIGKIIMHDILFLGPFTLLIILIVLYFGFKTIRGVLIPVITVAIAVIWTLGLMGALGFNITLVSNVTPVILLAVGSAYSIHVCSRIQLAMKTEQNIAVAVRKVLPYIVVPVFLAAFTTAIGFLSFIYGSYLVMIRDFGILTSCGVGFSFLLAVLLAPVIELLFPGKTGNNGQLPDKTSSFASRLSAFLYRLSSRHPSGTLVFWGVVTLIMASGAIFIERRVDLIDYFKKDHPARKAEEEIDRHFSGTIPVFVEVKGNILTPEGLSVLQRISGFFEAYPITIHPQSIARLFEEMNDLMGEGKVIPSDQSKIDNLWFLLQGQEVIDQLLTPDQSKALVQAVVTTSNSIKMNHLVDSLNHYITLVETPGFTLRQTGFPSVYRKLDESIIKSQLQSMSIAILLVLLLLGFMLRSFRRGLIGIAPILCTLAVLFGFLGWSGIPLDVATVLVASVSIGIGIDYSIHIISQFRNNLAKGMEVQEALKDTFRLAGRSVIINFLSVAAGFLVLTFSDLVPLQRFGVSVALTMISSGFASLTLLPALLLRTKNIWNKHFLKQ